jgi:hypothetical protein
MRDAKDAPKVKDYILPLVFAKRLCDVYDDEINRIAQEVGGRATYPVVRDPTISLTPSATSIWDRICPNTTPGRAAMCSSTVYPRC